ncbi:MAG: hypothetical protein ABEJ65_12525 [bacterium]
MKSIFKWSFIALVIVAGLLLLDLYTLNLVVKDPGYYVVARHSDTPAQVLDAVERLKHESLPEQKIDVLIKRYRKKVKNIKDPQARKLWKNALKRARQLKADTSTRTSFLRGGKGVMFS